MKDLKPRPDHPLDIPLFLRAEGRERREALDAADVIEANESALPVETAVIVPAKGDSDMDISHGKLETAPAGDAPPDDEIQISFTKTEPATDESLQEILPLAGSEELAVPADAPAQDPLPPAAAEPVANEPAADEKTSFGKTPIFIGAVSENGTLTGPDGKALINQVATIERVSPPVPVKLPVTMADRLAHLKEGVIGILPTSVVRAVFGKEAAVIATFHEADKAYAGIVAMDGKIQRAVDDSINDVKLAVLTFEGHKRLLNSSGMRAEISSFPILMNGVTTLGKAHGDALGEPAIALITQQLKDKKITRGKIFADTLSAIGEIAKTGEIAAKAGWPVLKGFVDDGKLKGEPMTKFLADSGEMAKISPALRAEILDEMTQAILTQAVHGNNINLKAAFDAVRAAAKDHEMEGLEACLTINHDMPAGVSPEPFLGNTTVALSREILNVSKLLKAFEAERVVAHAATQRDEAASADTETSRVRALLERVDEARILNPDIQLAHAFDEVSSVYILDQNDHMTHVEIVSKAEEEIHAIEAGRDEKVNALESQRRNRIKTLETDQAAALSPKTDAPTADAPTAAI